MKTIEIIMLPEDFKDANYVDGFNCPLSKAVRRTFNVDKEIDVAVDYADVEIRYPEKSKYFKNNGFNLLKFREVNELFKHNQITTYITTITEY